MPASHEIPFFFTHIFSWGFVLIGLFFLRNGLRGLIRAMSSTRWPTAQGRVIDCRLDFHSVSENAADVSFAKIQYRYAVERVEYVGSRISFADLSHTGMAAETYVKQHRKDAHIAVRYDPRKPSDAVLEPGVRAQVILGLILGLSLLGIGLGMVFAFQAWRF